MPSDFIAIDTQGVLETQKMLAQIPDAITDDGTDNANKYLLNVVRAYAPYKHITFQQAYGGWFSEKQRRYVMARIKEGSITPGRSNRNQRLSRGWKIIGKGRNSLLANEVPYSPYVQGEAGEQARMHTLIGWKGVDVIVKERMSKIVEQFMVGVNKALKRLAR